MRADGGGRLPNQWSVRPAGRQLPLGSFPVNVAISPSGAFAAVLHAGYGEHEIRIVDLAKERVVSTRPIRQGYYGLAWSHDGSMLYCSGADDEVVHAFRFERGRLKRSADFRLRPVTELGIPIGIGCSRDGAIIVAEGWGQRVVRLDARDGHVVWQQRLGASAGWATNTPESARVESSARDGAYPYGCLVDDERHRVYVSLWAKSAIAVLDLDTGRETTRWWVGAHPTEMALSRDGRLFVAEANLNSVSVLELKSGKVVERLSAAFEPNAPPGSMPNSVALDPAQRTLYVANADNNAIAVFDISDPRHSVSLGFIPVGWFPTSVRVAPDGKRLLVANGKGSGSAANPDGPDPIDPRPRPQEQYVGSVIHGSLSWIDLPDERNRAATFAEWTRVAMSGRPSDDVHRQARRETADNAIPTRPGDATPLRHVIYIVKENRTYDQVLGDVREGNGDASLCIFGERVTPNHHRLAKQFVLLDNFYADGEVSAVGHDWSLGAFASDFIEKTWPLSYGHNERDKYEYPGEGAYGFAAPAGGYLWDAAARAGLSYRSFGEFAHRRKDGTIAASIPELKDHVDPQFRPFDLNYSDVERAARFIAELHRFEREGEMPRLQVVHLGNDHTWGTTPKSRTPIAFVADNDLALGRIVDAVSHSKFWPDTVIFVLEDDAQNGSDHVDCHRMPAFAISPYARHGAVDSTLYSTTSMLRTIELILGLEPMSQYDQMAAPMDASFTANADLTPYTAAPARVDLDERNSELAWGARESQKMDFTQPDRINDLALNEIVWRSVKGADHPMPPPVRAAFVRPTRKVDAADDD
jgi:DNA-binding beta-propeller fold protein YncE